MVASNAIAYSSASYKGTMSDTNGCEDITLEDIKTLAETLAEMYKGTQYEKDWKEIALEARVALSKGTTTERLERLKIVLSKSNNLHEFREIMVKLKSDNAQDRLEGLGNLQKFMINDVGGEMLDSAGLLSLEASLMLLPAQITSSVVMDLGFNIGKSAIAVQNMIGTTPDDESFLKPLRYKKGEPPFYYGVVKKDDGYYLYYTSMSFWRDVASGEYPYYYRPPLESVEFRIENVYIGDTKIKLEKEMVIKDSVEPIEIRCVKVPIPTSIYDGGMDVKVKITWHEGGWPYFYPFGCKKSMECIITRDNRAYVTNYPI